jgi:hypothetical protein
MANNGVLQGQPLWNEITHLRETDEACLAPGFRAAIDVGLIRCNAAGIAVKIEETCRCQQLQDIYFSQGTTHAQSALRAWHIYGLAVDLVHPDRGWDLFPGGPAYNQEWCDGLVKAMKMGGALAWGGDWQHFKDWPHFQHLKCKPTPSDEAVRLYMAAGKQAVWAAVAAL